MITSKKLLDILFTINKNLFCYPETSISASDSSKETLDHSYNTGYNIGETVCFGLLFSSTNCIRHDMLRNIQLTGRK